MATVRGVSLTELDRQGDQYAALMTAQLRVVTRRAAAAIDDTPSVDDLADLPRLWTDQGQRELAPGLRVIYDEATQTVHKQLTQVASALVAQLGVEELIEGEIPEVPNEVAEAYLAQAQNRLVNVSNLVWELARTQLLEGLRAGESVPQLRARVTAAAELAAPRAGVVARTEVVGASNAGSLEQMRAYGLPATKTWVATGDSRTRPTHRAVNGATIDLPDSFSVGGFAMDRPHDPNGPASEVVSCRCTLTYDVLDDATQAQVLSQAQVEATYETLEGDPMFALRAYTGQGYREVNAALRAFSGDIEAALRANAMGPAQARMAHALDDLMAGGPRMAGETVVYRGTQGWPGMPPSDSMVGYRLTDQGFMSTSWNEQVTSQFRRGSRGQAVVFEIRVPQGARAVPVDKALGVSQKEAELLLDRNTSLIVEHDEVREILGEEVRWLRVRAEQKP